MDASWIAKQMIDFQKTTFDNMYNSMVMLQDHTEKCANTLFEQATWIPEEGSRVVNQWSDIFKKGRHDFKLAMDDFFTKCDDLLTATKNADSQIS
jgi:hypothetical protein